MSYKDMYKESKENKRTKQLVAEYKTFEKKGDQLLGRLLGKQSIQSKLGGEPYNQYLFDTDDGLVKCALGRVADGEAGVLMKEGNVYSIKFLGTEALAGGRRVNRFEIERVMTEDEARVGGDEDIPF